MPHPSTKCYGNQLFIFQVTRQSDNQTISNENISSLVEVMKPAADTAISLGWLNPELFFAAMACFIMETTNIH